jgi:hypothetical protein
MSDQWWSSARQPPGAVPFRNKFDAARDPLTARVAIGAVDAKYVADAIAAAGGGGGGNVSNSGTPTSGQYAKWVTATTIQGVAPATVLSDIGAQPAGSYQPLDADLTSLAAASGTDTIYYRSAANTWSPVTIGANLTFSSGTLAATGGGTASTTDIGLNCGRLEYVSATALSFKPYNGDRIRINGTIYAIPSGGIAGLANTGVFVNGTGGSSLGNNVLYYVYAFNNGGTITADYSTTGHATSTTAGNVGMEIKSGNDSRTLIGMVYTSSGGQFIYAANFKLVVTWFNRRNLAVLSNSTASAATSSASDVELSTNSRINFLVWNDEHVLVTIMGGAYNTGAGATAQFNVGLDGTTAAWSADMVATSSGSNDWNAIGAANVLISLSEGYHVLTPIGRANSGSTTASLQIGALVRG